MQKPDISERLELLIILLLCEGRVKNERIRHILDITQPYTSRLIRQLREEYPNWVELDTFEKSYVATEDAYKEAKELGLWSRGALEAYVEILKTDRLNPPVQCFSAIPAVLTPPAEVFGRLNYAINMGYGVKVHYRSMENPTPTERILYPHALVQTSKRWHVRAYCPASESYKDFNLGRMSNVEPITDRVSFEYQPRDSEWNLNVSVEIVPHRDLNDAQKEMIQDEFLEGAKIRKYIVRAALVRYYIASLSAAVDVTTQKAPTYLLEVSNVDELIPYISFDKRIDE